MLTIKLPNTNIKFIKSHKSTNLLGAVGQRTAVFITNKDLSLKRQFVDENKLELFTCMDFLDYNSKIYAIIGGALGIIKIIDVSTGKFYGYLTAHTGLITDIKVYNKFIISSSEDCSIKVWDFESFTRVLVINHKEVVLNIDINNSDNSDINLNKSDINLNNSDIKLNNSDIKPTNKPTNKLSDINNSDINLTSILTSCMDQKIREFINGRLSYCIENIHRELYIKSLYYGRLVVTLEEGGIITIVRPHSKMESSDGIMGDDTPFLFLKELKYKGAINIDIIEHNLLILTKNEGLFIIYLPDVLEEFTIRHIKNERQGVCVTSNKDYIFVLYEESVIEAYPYN